MHQQILDVMRALSSWLNSEQHRPNCEWGQVVQSGPLEGNKIPCTCGLLDLQSAVERATTLQNVELD